jgi:hypothetical protein
MSQTFHDPRDFLSHLESAISQGDQLAAKDTLTLLHASVHTIRYLIDSQAALTHKVIGAVDVLNSNHETWGHKLAELYDVLEAGVISPEEMNELLRKEVHPQT